MFVKKTNFKKVPDLQAISWVSETKPFSIIGGLVSGQETISLLHALTFIPNYSWQSWSVKPIYNSRMLQNGNITHTKTLTGHIKPAH